MLLSAQLVRSTRCRNIAGSALCRAARSNTSTPFTSWRCLASKASTTKTPANTARQAATKSAASVAKVISAPASAAKATPPKPLAFTESTPSDLSAPKPFTFRGTDGTSPATPSGAKGYPAQLLVYHAGSGGITFVAVWKLTALLGFIFAAVYVAPYYYYSPLEEDTLMAALIVFGGTIPLITLMYSTYPIVTFVHLALPTWARASRERLLKYLQHLPSSAIVDITSLRWIWPRVTRLHVSELHIPQVTQSAQGSGTATAAGTVIPRSFALRRQIPAEVRAKRPWYGWRPENGFTISGHNSTKVQDHQIWTEMLRAVQRGWHQQRHAAKAETEKMRARLDKQIPSEAPKK